MNTTKSRLEFLLKEARAKAAILSQKQGGQPNELPTQTTPPTQIQVFEEKEIAIAVKDIKRGIIRRVSYSALNTLRECERKYYLDRFIVGARDSNVDTAFGHAVGSGIQKLWETGSLDKAAMACFLAWNTPFGDTKEASKKSIGHALKAVKNFLPFYQILSQEWDLAFIFGKPCIEFSLKIEFPNDFFYRGYADLILQHKETKEYCVVELKTTGMTWEHEASYKNSDQGIFYSLMLDQIAPEASSFWVKYFAYFSKSMEWVPFDFPKRLIDKARWIRTTLLDMKDIEERERDDYWPMRGNSCMSFGRPCRYFDICQFPDTALLSSDALLTKKFQEEEARKYSFVVNLKDVVAGYLS